MTPEAISAPNEGFRQGRCRIRGYCMEDEGDRVVLERFAVCDAGEERLVERGAARDALQAWLDAVAL